MTVAVRVRALTLGVLSLVGCSEPAGSLDPRQALAVKIDGPGFDLELTRAEVSESLARAHLESDREAPDLEPDAKRAVLDELIDRHLAAHAARKAGVSTSSTAIARELAAIRADLELRPQALAAHHRSESDLAAAIEDRLLWGALVARAVETSSPSEDALRARWQAEPLRAERIQAGQIVVETAPEARKVLKALSAGEDFRALARARSVAPEAEQGGDLGWFERGDMPHVFEEACFPLDPGDTSPVVPSTYGYHVFRVYARAPAGREPYPDARARLIREWKAERRADAERSLRQALRDDLTIRYVAEVLRPLGVPLSAEEIETR